MRSVARFKEVAVLEPNAQLLFYQGYPKADANQFSTNWLSPNPPEDGTNPRSFNRRAYTDMLEAALNSEGLSIGVIRSGEVLYEIDQLAISGNFPGGINSVHEFFAGSVHMNDDGDYIAYATTYHTIYGVMPPSVPTGIGTNLSIAQINKIHEVIAAVNINPPSVHFQSIPEPSAWMFGFVGIGLIGCRHLRQTVAAKRKS